MSADAQRDIDAGTGALRAGDWAAARTAFEAALARDDSPEALSGLGDALAWQGETEAAVQMWQRAYGAFLRRPRPDPVQAAAAAINLSITYDTSLGNDVAARGWLDRLARLVDDCELEPLRGWTLVIRAAHNAHGIAGRRGTAARHRHLLLLPDDRHLQPGVGDRSRGEMDPGR